MDKLVTGGSIMAVTYEELLLESSIEYIQILSIKTHVKLNDHGRMTIKLRLDAENQSAEKMSSEAEVILKNTVDDTILFCGYVSQMEIAIHHAFKEVTLEIITGSQWLDYEKRVRSFQGMTFSEIINEIFKTYGTKPYVDIEDNNLIFAIQYYETDFEFIKRIASEKSLVVMPHLLDSKAKLYIDIKNKDKLITLDTLDFSRYDYSETKISYEDSYYSFESFEALGVGDQVKHSNHILVVRDVKGWLKDGLMVFKYLASVKYYAHVKPIEHEYFAGTGLIGKVIAVENNNIKVHFDVDEHQDIEKAVWMPYGPIGCNGWYAMPKVGTKILIRFENENPSSGIGIGVIREGVDSRAKMENPKEKSFTTDDGHYLGLSPDMLEISTDLTSICLGDGIQVVSNDKLLLSSDSAINIGETIRRSYDENMTPIDVVKRTGSVKINALEQLSIVVTSKGTGLELDDEVRIVSLSNMNTVGSERQSYETIVINNDLSPLMAETTTSSATEVAPASDSEPDQKDEVDLEKEDNKSNFMDFLKNCGEAIVNEIEVVTSSIPVIVSGFMQQSPKQRLALEAVSGGIAGATSHEILTTNSSSENKEGLLNPILKDRLIKSVKQSILTSSESLESHVSKLNVIPRTGLNLADETEIDIAEQLKSEAPNISEIKWGESLDNAGMEIVIGENFLLEKNTFSIINSENEYLDIVNALNSLQVPENYNREQSVQYYLNQIGFNVGEEDGDIGVKSASGLIIYQYYMSLKITGLADFTSWSSLKMNASKLTYEIIMNSDKILNWVPQEPSIPSTSENNGKLDTSKLTVIPGTSSNGWLQKEAAVAWALMVDWAKKDDKFRINTLLLTGRRSGYRTYKDQEDLFEAKGRKPALAAIPGTSQHGWGKAIDINVCYYGQSQKGTASTYEMGWIEKTSNYFGYTPYLNKDNPVINNQNNYFEAWHWNYLKKGRIILSRKELLLGNNSIKKNETVSKSATNDNMDASQNLIEFIKQYEKFEEKPYRGQDSQNETIGFGHVIQSGENFDTLTEKEAEELLRKDLRSRVDYVNRQAKKYGLDLKQHEFDGLVDMVFNKGQILTPESATFFKLIVENSNDNEEIFYQFSRWNKVNKEFSLGVYRRSTDSADIFLNADYTRNYRERPHNF